MIAAALHQIAGDFAHGALRQGGRDDRDDDQVGGAEHLLAGFGQAGRAVEDDAVIIAAQAFDQLGQPLLLVHFAEQMIETAQRRVGGDEVQTVAGRLRPRHGRGAGGQQARHASQRG